MVKRKLNEYFKLMLKSKKQGAESFEYGGNHYDKIINEKTGMILYKKRQTKPSAKQMKQEKTPKQQKEIQKPKQGNSKQQSCKCPKDTKKTEKKSKTNKK